MKTILSYFLIFSLLVQTCIPLFAGDNYQSAADSELLSLMSLQEYYADKVRLREQQRFDLEAELETLQSSTSANPSIRLTQQQRIATIERDLQTVESSLSQNQQQYSRVQQNIETLGTSRYGDNAGYKDEQVGALISAANVTTANNALTSASMIPSALSNATPTGVIAQQNGITTSIERWSNGKYYQVSRYSEGPNAGRFAPGGRTELSSSEVRQMGSQLRSMQVEGLQANVQHTNTQIDSLRTQLNNTTDSAARNRIQSDIERLEKTQSELKSELRRSQAKPVTDFIKSGVSFAAMSVAITGGVNIVRQIIDANGDLSQVNLGQAFQFVTQGQYWAGVGGSFTGSMIGAALTSFLPGPFKVFGAIAGGSVGYQIGTGNWRDADWTRVAMQSIGSTVGYVIGAFIGSLMGPLAPVAIIAFSMLGSWLADKALEWMRGAFTPDISSMSITDIQDTEFTELEEYTDAIPTDDYADVAQLSDEELQEQLWMTYNEYQAMQQQGPEASDDNSISQWKMNMVRSWSKYNFIRKTLDERKKSFSQNPQQYFAAR